MMNRPCYFDYASTTPVDERVLQGMLATLSQSGAFGNPASHLHYYGWEARELIGDARSRVAACLGADPKEIIWTSGATESNNLAILGIARAGAKYGRHVITLATEHKSVLEPCKQLEKEGFEITVLRPEVSGLINLASLQAALRPDTILVSVMMVNNEMGCIQPIAEIGSLLKNHLACFHVDAVQAAGKLRIHVKEMGIDALSLSAHKIYGPKGSGVLYLNRYPRVPCSPLLFGGEQEDRLRPGTLPTHQIVGLAQALSLAELEREEEWQRISDLKQYLWSVLSTLDGVHLNGHLSCSSPYILNLSFEGVDGEALFSALDQFALSSGSACTSGSIEPSHVLLALGQTRRLAQSAVRFSFGRYTTLTEVQALAAAVVAQVKKLRKA